MPKGSVSTWSKVKSGVSDHPFISVFIGVALLSAALFFGWWLIGGLSLKSFFAGYGIGVLEGAGVISLTTGGLYLVSERQKAIANMPGKKTWLQKVLNHPVKSNALVAGVAFAVTALTFAVGFFAFVGRKMGYTSVAFVKTVINKRLLPMWGTVVAACVSWVKKQCFPKKNSKPKSQPPVAVMASQGGLAAGGDQNEVAANGAAVVHVGNVGEGAVVNVTVVTTPVSPSATDPAQSSPVSSVAEEPPQAQPAVVETETETETKGVDDQAEEVARLREELKAVSEQLQQQRREMQAMMTPVPGMTTPMMQPIIYVQPGATLTYMSTPLPGATPPQTIFLENDSSASRIPVPVDPEHMPALAHLYHQMMGVERAHARFQELLGNIRGRREGEADDLTVVLPSHQRQLSEDLELQLLQFTADHRKELDRQASAQALALRGGVTETEAEIEATEDNAVPAAAVSAPTTVEPHTTADDVNAELLRVTASRREELDAAAKALVGRRPAAGAGRAFNNRNNNNCARTCFACGPCISA